MAVKKFIVFDRERGLWVAGLDQCSHPTQSDGCIDTTSERERAQVFYGNEWAEFWQHTVPFSDTYEIHVIDCQHVWVPRLPDVNPTSGKSVETPKPADILAQCGKCGIWYHEYYKTRETKPC